MTELRVVLLASVVRASSIHVQSSAGRTFRHA